MSEMKVALTVTVVVEIGCNVFSLSEDKAKELLRKLEIALRAIDTHSIGRIKELS